MKKLKTPPQTKPVKPQTEKNYSKYSGSSNKIKYSLTICSTGENMDLQIGIVLNEKYFIVIPKNKTALESFDKWFDGFFEKEKTESIETLETLLNNNELFEVKEHSKESYKEYLEINAKNWSELTNLPRAKYPPKPNKSFELLKDWYYVVLEIEKNTFIETSIDISPEILNTFEIKLIEKQCKVIENHYFPEKETVYDNHLHKSLGTTEIELTANRTFLQWLNERKTVLQQKKVFSEEEEVKKEIAGVKNWSDIQRVYLLKQIGFDEMKIFKELGQIRKYELIANILNCSIRKAKENYNHCEKKLTFEKREDVKNYLKKISKEK